MSDAPVDQLEEIRRIVNASPKPIGVQIRKLLHQLETMVDEKELQRAEAVTELARSKRAEPKYTRIQPKSPGWYWVKVGGLCVGVIPLEKAQAYFNTFGVEYAGPLWEPR